MPFQNLSYRYIETEPNMVLSLRPEGKSFDDYLASLTSKYRSGVRNAVFKPMAEAGCVVEHLEDLAPYQDRIFELYKSVQMNADFRPVQLPPDYFVGLQRVAGSRLRCSIVRKNDVILGFLISLADGDTALAYHIGFDRDAAVELPVLFTCVCFTPGSVMPSSWAASRFPTGAPRWNRRPRSAPSRRHSGSWSDIASRS